MKRDTEAKRVQITLSLELYQALKQRAEEELRTVPAQIRQILKASLVPKESPQDSHPSK